jgi:excinuclease ABC subunit C
MLPQEIEERKIIAQWLRSKRGGEKVELFVPKEGQPRDLVQMAAENASETLQALRAQWQADAHKQEQALSELQTALKLSAPPNRIECYDVSHTQGVATVGAMVVFEQGVPAKRLYRKFNIESTSIGAPDDFASMEEMLTRRFRRWKGSQETEANVGSKKDEAFSILPDLIIIDGGKGQLSRIVKVLEKFELFDKVPGGGSGKAGGGNFLPAQEQAAAAPPPFAGTVPRAADPRRGASLWDHRASQKTLETGSCLPTGFHPRHWSHPPKSALETFRFYG